ncbi:hypothetical protein I79_003589 [Cricetulus griseus]|uniref:Uncharacterized protein n=1 Tax=Cricetulus griseus TaxID=10029 RepID=G3H0D4_CRIGR|nr:hypothetical protein I79_003589 [Cricetulus griseus]
MLAGPQKTRAHQDALSQPTHLIILDTLHGELVTVHPQGISEDGQSVKLLQLEGLWGRKEDCGASATTAQLGDQYRPLCCSQV